MGVLSFQSYSCSAITSQEFLNAVANVAKRLNKTIYLISNAFDFKDIKAQKHLAPYYPYKIKPWLFLDAAKTTVARGILDKRLVKIFFMEIWEFCLWEIEFRIRVLPEQEITKA